MASGRVAFSLRRRSPARRRPARPALALLPVLLAILAAATVVTAAGLFASPAAAQVKSWRIDSVDAKLQVQESSDVLVDETVTFVFVGHFSFVTRSIPTTNLEGLDDFAVLQNGTALPQGSGPGTWELAKEGDRRIIKVNLDATDTSLTYTFRYVARGAIQYLDERDQLVWYVFDAETPVPIAQVRTTVTLPGSLGADQLTAAISTGPSVQGQVAHTGPSELVYTAADVPPYTQFWISAGFPKDVVQFQLTARRMAAFLVPKVGFLLPILTLLGMLLIWRRRGRDDPQGVFARFVTEPPSDLSPALVGALIDERVDVKEVVATIVDLARRGYLVMTESTKDGLLFDRTITTFRRLKPSSDLTGTDYKVMEAVFDHDSDEVTTDDLKNKFYVHVQPICKAVYEEVTGRKLFVSNPESTRSRWLVMGIGVGVILGVLTFLLAGANISGWGFFLVGSVLSAIIVIVFSRAMPARTPKGAQELRKWEAFRNYLRDLTRFQDMETGREVFDRYLPYAVAMGVEREWVRRFHDLAIPAPDWYRPVYVPGWGTGGMPGTHATGLPVDLGGGGGGGGGLSMPSLDSISDSLFGSLNSVSNVLTSTPSGEKSGGGAWGGGGGGGGGFSGGGGGGGFGAG